MDYGKTDYGKIHDRIDTAIEYMEEANQRLRDGRKYELSDAAEEVRILKSRIAMALKIVSSPDFASDDTYMLKGVLDGSLDDKVKRVMSIVEKIEKGTP